MAQFARIHEEQDVMYIGLLPADGTPFSSCELTQPIPVQVLQLLKQAWQRPNGVSEFEAGFTATKPSAERYVHVDQRDNPDSAFRHDEIDELVASGVFEGLVTAIGGGVAVNVHAEHALADFCSEVYEAWDRLQDRLEAARAVAARGS